MPREAIGVSKIVPVLVKSLLGQEKQEGEVGFDGQQARVTDTTLRLVLDLANGADSALRVAMANPELLAAVTKPICLLAPPPAVPPPSAFPPRLPSNALSAYDAMPPAAPPAAPPAMPPAPAPADTPVEAAAAVAALANDTAAGDELPPAPPSYTPSITLPPAPPAYTPAAPAAPAAPLAAPSDSLVYTPDQEALAIQVLRPRAHCTNLGTMVSP